jgi:hypothetical protein
MAAIEESKSQPIPRLTRPEARPVSSAARGSDLAWNLLTMLVWLGMASMVVIFLSIYNNPTTPLNPFSPAPPTLVSVIRLPTETLSPQPVIQRTASSTPTLPPSATPVTPTATRTSLPTATDTPTPGPSPTPTIDSLYPFILRNEPFVIAGDAMPDHDTCKLWVAGQSYDLQNAPMVGITVMLGGYLDGKTLYQLSLTGTALQFGQAGYEFIIADRPVASKGSVWVQLFDQALIPLSSRVYFDTYEDCEHNLLLINFKQVR